MKIEDAGKYTEECSGSDVLTPAQRRLVMSRIKAKHSKPEVVMRRGLHNRGLRYRLHSNTVPGRPDMVFPKYHTVIFVNGCFWHGHGCSLFKWPKTRADFWRTKINQNIDRDRKALAALKADGWCVLVVWECALKGKRKRDLPAVLTKAESFIRYSGQSFAEITEYESTDSWASRMRPAKMQFAGARSRTSKQSNGAS